MSKFLPFCLAAVAIGPWTLRADPTNEQQYWLELINQARRDPVGELSRLVDYDSPTTFASPASNNSDIAQALDFFGVSASDLAAQWSTLTAAPPLAWSNALANSAQSYSQLMVSSDQQSHTLDGLSYDQRVAAGGYSLNYLDVGENLYANSKSVAYAHAGFLIDWGDSDSNPNNGFGNGIQGDLGHRLNLYEAAFKEIGLGIVRTGIPGGNVNAIGPDVITQHLANQFREVNGELVVDAILTGVVYADAILANHFYTPGEGLGGVAVRVFDDVTNDLLFATATNSAGGFNIDLLGVTDGQQLRIEVPGFGVDRQYFTVNSYTTDPLVYGEEVKFFDNLYAGFVVAPEPSGAAMLLLAGLILRCRRRRFCFDKGRCFR
ncbi:MAG: hypothetical protein JWO08_364 [Verrucomicrobiaceae bacterium]|nr:hypothetical protein [Verrucomicrobiaceae bacterium]